MKNSILKISLAAFALIISLSSFGQKAETKEQLLKQVKEMTAANQLISKYLQTFDTLDYTVFSNRDWKRLHESHAKDIIVHFPDGHSEVGIEQHIKTLDAMFVYAPDTRIEEHPIKIGSGNITAVMGYMLGTFTEPMPIYGQL